METWLDGEVKSFLTQFFVDFRCFLLPLVKVLSLHHLSKAFITGQDTALCASWNLNVSQRGIPSGIEGTAEAPRRYRATSDLWPRSPRSLCPTGMGMAQEGRWEVRSWRGMQGQWSRRGQSGGGWKVRRAGRPWAEWGSCPMRWPSDSGPCHGESVLSSPVKKKRERMPWMKSSNQDEARLLGCITMPYIVKWLRFYYHLSWYLSIKCLEYILYEGYLAVHVGNQHSFSYLPVAVGSLSEVDASLSLSLQAVRKANIMK